MRGLIIYYVNVGFIEGDKVQAYLEGRKQAYLAQPGVQQLITDSGYTFSVVPVRGDEDTRLELLPLP